MNIQDIERQIVLLSEYAPFTMTGKANRSNNAMAFQVTEVTPATARYAKLNPKGAAEDSRGFSPFDTGDDVRPSRYVEQSLALSRARFEAGTNDGSLHHALLAAAKKDALPEGFISFSPQAMFEDGDPTLARMARLYTALTDGKRVAREFSSDALMLVRPPASTIPDFTDLDRYDSVTGEPLDLNLKRRFTTPHFIGNVAENPAYQGMPLWRAAEQIDNDWPDGTRHQPYGFFTSAPEKPRSENSMTVAEVLLYAAAYPEQVRGKKIAALRSWHGGAMYWDHGMMQGSGSYLVLEFADNGVVITPINVNAIAGRDAVALTYRTVIVRSRKPRKILKHVTLPTQVHAQYSYDQAMMAGHPKVAPSGVLVNA